MALDLKAIQDVADDDAFWLEIAREMGIRLGSVSRRIIFDGVEAAQAAGALVDMDGIHEAAIQATRDLDTEWWRKIERTTRDSLRTTLLLWQEQGLGKRGLPDLVDSLQPLFSRARAKRIAQTESTRLFAEGNILAARDDDSVGGMEWQTARDELVCPICAPLNGLIYPKGNVHECPAHVNCRCSVQPATWEHIRENPSKWQGGPIPTAVVEPVSPTQGPVASEMARTFDGTTYRYEEDTPDGTIRMNTARGLSPDQFDPDAELARIKSAHKRTRETFLNEGKFLKAMGEPQVLTTAAERRIPVNVRVSLTNDAKDAGMGSGGLSGNSGYARVFWNPYELKGRVLAANLSAADEVDPIFVLCHELHHAYGSDTEFDELSGFLSLDWHFANGDNLIPDSTANVLTDYVSAGSRRAKGNLAELYRRDRTGVAWLYRRNPQAVEAALRRGWAKDAADSWLEKIKAWK